MRIIIHMGGAWRLSARAVAKLRKLVLAGEGYDLDLLGTYLGEACRPADLEDE